MNWDSDSQPSVCQLKDNLFVYIENIRHEKNRISNLGSPNYRVWEWLSFLGGGV